MALSSRVRSPMVGRASDTDGTGGVTAGPGRSMSWAISGATETSGFTDGSFVKGVIGARPDRLGAARGQRGADSVSDNNTKDNNHRQPEPCALRGHGSAYGGRPWPIEQRIARPVSNQSSQSVHSRERAHAGVAASRWRINRSDLG